MNDSRTVSAIAIYGGPLEIWSAAALLARELPRDITIKLVETDSPCPVHALSFNGDGLYHARAGISELELVSQCDGNLSLGHRYTGWRGDDSDYFDAPAGKLPGLNGIGLHHLLLRAAQQRGEPEKLAELSTSFRFPALAGMNGKLTHASDDPRSPRSMLRILVHVGTEKYIDLLKRKALESQTIEHHLAASTDPVLANAGGRISAIRSSEGQEISADLFIDMDGGLDNRSAVQTHPVFDRMMSTDVSDPNGNQAYATSHAMDHAVLHHIPLRGKQVRVLSYASAHMDDASAQKLIGARAEPRTLQLRMQSEPWQNNLVQAGPASGAMQSPENADIALLQGQLCRIAETLPVSDDMHIEAGEYNRLHNMHFEQLRSFHILPYILNSRTCESWSAWRDQPVPNDLQIRLDQFKSRGRFVTFDGETHDEQRWIDMMIGFGHIPQRFDPMARSANMAKVGQSLGGMVEAFKQTVAAMPTHADYMVRVVSLAQKEAPIDEFAI